jgi:hypothetical protein
MAPVPETRNHGPGPSTLNRSVGPGRVPLSGSQSAGRAAARLRHGEGAGDQGRVQSMQLEPANLTPSVEDGIQRCGHWQCALAAGLAVACRRKEREPEGGGPTRKRLRSADGRDPSTSRGGRDPTREQARSRAISPAREPRGPAHASGFNDAEGRRGAAERPPSVAPFRRRSGQRSSGSRTGPTRQTDRQIALLKTQ